MTAPSPSTPPLQFPSHPYPRTWFLTSAASALGIAVARAVLAHGDETVLCIEPEEHGLVTRARGLANGHRALFAGSNGPGSERAGAFVRFVTEEVDAVEEWRGRCRIVGLDGSIIGQCQAAIAQAVQAFGKIDILFCCSSEGSPVPVLLPSTTANRAPAVIGTVEELAACPRTLTLIREQFETNFFSPVNIIKAALPAMREKRGGHIIVLTGISRSCSGVLRGL
ncbi:hypothetical protein MMC34_006548 [Xylographa carneopallida]|nr:hypothetical protein [Xylographa carneopallida]